MPKLQSKSAYYTAPLSHLQLEEALTFAKRTVDESDPYNINFPKTGVLLTLGTPFGRISAFARKAYRAGAKLDREFMMGLNSVTALKTHYSVQAVSSHKRISIRRCIEHYHGNGRSTFKLYKDTVHGTVEAVGSQFAETVWFEYSFVSEYDYFEIAVPKFLGLTIERQRIPHPLL